MHRRAAIAPCAPEYRRLRILPSVWVVSGAVPEGWCIDIGGSLTLHRFVCVGEHFLPQLTLLHAGRGSAHSDAANQLSLALHSVGRTAVVFHPGFGTDSA